MPLEHQACADGNKKGCANAGCVRRKAGSCGPVMAILPQVSEDQKHQDWSVCLFIYLQWLNWNGLVSEALSGELFSPRNMSTITKYMLAY